MLIQNTSGEHTRGVKLQRSVGAGKLAVKFDGNRTQLADLYQRANAKIRIPKTHDKAMEAVLINTSGGMTGGDELSWKIEALADTHLTVTTQACEKIYRSQSGVANVTTSVEIADHALVEWLPQETILFDQSGLHRKIEINLAASAGFIGLEAVVLGRRAMGEPVRQISFADRWRIVQSGKVVHADNIKLEGSIEALLQKPAALNGAASFATLVICLPESQTDQADLTLAQIQAALPRDSYWSANQIGTKIVARFVAQDMYQLRQRLVPVLYAARQQRPLPKVWRT